jgi:hypothetical protein
MAVIPAAVIVGILCSYFAYMVLASYFRLSGYARRFEREEAPRIRAALEHGGASVCSVTSNRVLVIEESEDEGSAYIYDLGDGTSLYLRGQDYQPEDGRAPWPARRFEIVRTGTDNRLVGIFGSDEALKPFQVIPMAEMPESFWFADEPQTETVLEGRPEDIVRRLGHAA